MKNFIKNILNLLLITILFANCEPEPKMEPPTLNITPQDTQEISSIFPVTFHINGFANEDLKSFNISTAPYFFEFDSIFGTFKHTLEMDITIELPELLPDLTSDSLISVTFELSDNYDKTTIIRILKVVDGFPPIITNSATLTYKHDSALFYSFDTETALTFEQITDRNFDLILLKDDTYGFVLASPSAALPANTLTDIGYTYSASNKNKTSMMNFNTNFDDVDNRFIYYLDVSNSYIDDNVGYGVGITNLEENDIIAFKTFSGKKGVMMITHIDSLTNSLSFSYKYQIRVAE